MHKGIIDFFSMQRSKKKIICSDFNDKLKYFVQFTKLATITKKVPFNNNLHFCIKCILIRVFYGYSWVVDKMFSFVWTKILTRTCSFVSSKPENWTPYMLFRDCCPCLHPSQVVLRIKWVLQDHFSRFPSSSPDTCTFLPLFLHRGTRLPARLQAA